MSIAINEASREEISAIEHKAFVNAIDEGHFYGVYQCSLDGYETDPVVVEVNAKEYAEAYSLCENAMREYTRDFGEKVKYELASIAGNDGSGECRVVYDLDEITQNGGKAKPAKEEHSVCEDKAKAFCDKINAEYDAFIDKVTALSPVEQILTPSVISAISRKNDVLEMCEDLAENHLSEADLDNLLAQDDVLDKLCKIYQKPDWLIDAEYDAFTEQLHGYIAENALAGKDTAKERKDKGEER